MKTQQNLLFICLFIILTPAVFAQTTPAADYPYQPIPFTQVKFTDAFWLPRIETNRTETIPFAFKMCEDTNRLENFKIAAGLSDKKWDGDFGFNDSDIYKVVEGASYALMVKPDAKLDAYLDEVIGYIAAAQEDNGYLYTAWTARAKDHRKNIACCYNAAPWDNLRDAHELYNLGHMYEAAAAHYLATEKHSFLDVAVKSADLVCDVFGPRKNEGIPGHQEIELGLVKLYRVTGEKKYLDQAKWFLDQRGRYKGFRAEYSQSHKPVVDQTEAVGHAVRATYMYSSMADIAALTGDADYLKAIDALWDNVANKKLYVTGGIGARHSGEAYGDNYELPNRSAYCETCAAIANVYWNHRMFLLHGDAKYIDVMERSLYNGVISGVSLDGMKFFYPNPLESANGHERSPWFGCACCPSNICRFLASVPGYAYAVTGDTAYVNLFVNSTATFDVAGSPVTFTQTTEYPWDGAVKIEVAPRKSTPFALKVRIPDWARGTFDSSDLYDFGSVPKTPLLLLVNGKPVDIKIDKGYADITRTWQKGDTVAIILPMEIKRVTCDEKVADDRGKAAIQRGPLTYCLEHLDVEDGRVLNLMLKKDAKLTAAHNDDLLGGITVIEGTAAELQRSPDGKTQQQPKTFHAIPYYAWAHREKGPMAVWIPYSEKQANPLPSPTIASQSNVTTSFLSNVGNTRPESVNDQAVPQSSGDHEKGFLHWWPHKGTTEWIQYDFKQPADVANVTVYWFDDTGKGECRVPASWRVLYRENGQWKPVENFSDYKVTKDDFDRVSFLPVKTDALRLEVTFKEGYSSGVHEWIVE